MERKSIEELRDEIELLQKQLTSLQDMRELTREKRKKRSDIAGLEERITKLRGVGAVPKQVWRSENELAKETRVRNALAARLNEARIEERRAVRALVEKKREYLKELKSKPPRKIRR